MTSHVNWHAVDMSGEVGAMVEIKAAEEKLIRFAAATMLGGD
jgi:hypothetical protein